MVPLTVLAIGPVSTGAANAIANAYNFLVEGAPPVAAAVVGGIWQVIVIFGVHWGVTPMVMANFANQGYDSFVNAINSENMMPFIGEVIGLAISIIGAIVLVQIVGFEEPKTK